MQKDISNQDIDQIVLNIVIVLAGMTALILFFLSLYAFPYFYWDLAYQVPEQLVHLWHWMQVSFELTPHIAAVWMLIGLFTLTATMGLLSYYANYLLNSKVARTQEEDLAEMEQEGYSILWFIVGLLVLLVVFFWAEVILL